MKRTPRQAKNGRNAHESEPGTPPAPANDRDPADVIIDASMPSLARAVETLGGYLGRLGEIVAKADHDRDTASHFGWLTKQTSGILAELRRLAESRAKLTDRLDVETVLRFLRTTTEDKRAHVMREVEAMGKGSVLA